MSMSRQSAVELPHHDVDARLPRRSCRQRQLKKQLRLQDAKTKLSSPWASGMAIVLAILWTIPTFGLFVTSFRPQADIETSRLVDVLRQPRLHASTTTRQAFSGSGGLGAFFLNSFVIVFPAVIIPITLALLAAYAFAWIDFKGRDFLFVAIFALQIVPMQVALIPLQTIFVNFGLQNSFWPVWIAHTIFGLPLAIFLLHNFMKEVPRSIVEAARVDGAGHVKIFFVVLLPLLVPAIAAFGIFQFLWVWNDLLVAIVFAPSPNLKPDHRGHRRAVRYPRPGLAAAVGRCVHRDRRSAGRVPRPAALLRPRPAGRRREGLIAQDRKKRSCPVQRSNPPASSKLRRCPGSHPQRCRGHSGDCPECPRPPGWRSRKRPASSGTSRRPSAAALTTGQTNAIGVIAPWVSRWFFSAVVEGAQEVLAQQGYDLLLYPVGVGGWPPGRRAGHQVADQTGRRPAGAERAAGRQVDGLAAGPAGPGRHRRHGGRGHVRGAGRQRRGRPAGDPASAGPRSPPDRVLRRRPRRDARVHRRRRPAPRVRPDAARGRYRARSGAGSAHRILDGRRRGRRAPGVRSRVGRTATCRPPSSRSATRWPWACSTPRANKG